MEYQTASRIRKTGWADIFADQLSDPKQTITGAIKKTFSLKTLAFEKGIKQKFDPLNVAKFLTGGSSLGPALLGKLTGRSARDIQFFTGRYRPIRSYDTVSKLKPITATEPLTKVGGDQSGMLNKIYQLLRESQFKDTKRRNKEINFLEEKELEDKKRHDEFMEELKKFLNVPSILIFDKKQQQEKGLFDSIWDKIKDLWPAGIGGVPGKTNPKTPGPEPIKPGGTPKTTPTPPEPPKGAEKASTMKSTLKALLPWVGPTIVAAGLDFAIEETAKYKEELEANPFDPKFDNIPYAQVLRGEKETVGKAGAENRKETFTKMRRGDVEEILKTLNAIEIFNAYGVYKQDLQDWLDKNPEPSAMISLKMQPLPEGPTEEELTAKRLAEEDREKLIQEGTKAVYIAPKSGIRKKKAQPVSTTTTVPSVEKSQRMVQAVKENSQLNLPKPQDDVQTMINNISNNMNSAATPIIKLTEVAVRNTEETFRRLIIDNTRVV